MSEKSTIEWTDATWNPVRGCSKISPGCKHCYAETFAERFRGVPGHPYEQGFDVRMVPEKLDEPLRWRTPRRVFVNSMSDLFHASIPFEYIDRVFATMRLAERHTFQVLTKRADRMKEYVDSARRRSMVDGLEVVPGRPITWERAHANVWQGVSVEDRKYGLPRIAHLRETPAAVRFLSVEPLLEDLGALDLRGIHWVIVGGESGAGARPMKAEWVRSIREQCAAAGVAFFFKQRLERGRKVSTPELDGRRWVEFPESAR